MTMCLLSGLVARRTHSACLAVAIRWREATESDGESFRDVVCYAAAGPKTGPSPNPLRDFEIAASLLGLRNHKI